MEEIIDAVTFEIESSGYLDKLAAGMVLTGGGALLRHLPQLVKFRTGLDVRVGLPNEQLAGDADQEVNQPMYSTSVGLVLKGYEILEQQQQRSRMTEEETKEDETGEETPVRKGLIETLKNAFTDMFEEKGASM